MIMTILAALEPPPFNGEILSVLLLLLGALILFVTEWLSVDLIAVLVILVLTVSGILDPEGALSGFSHPAVIGVGALFIVSEGLLRTGALGVLANRLETMSQGRESRFMVLTLGIVLVSSAFLNNTPVVAMFIPVVLGISRKIGINPSHVLIPLSYAAILGGTCSLIGTSTNLLVATIVAQEEGLRELRMFEFTALGAILSAAGMIYLIFFARKMIPERQTITTLTAQSGTGLREYATELEVEAGGALDGKKFSETPLADTNDIRILQVIRGEEILWPPFTDTVLQEGDALVIAGTVEHLMSIQQEQGLATLADILAEKHGSLAERETELAEVLIQSESHYAGQKLGEVQLRRRFGVQVLAILRHGMHLRQKLSEHPLRVGDVLLVQGTPDGLERIGAEEGLVLLSGIEDVTVRRTKAPIALTILIGVVGMLALQLETFPLAIVALRGSCCDDLDRLPTGGKGLRSDPLARIGLDRWHAGLGLRAPPNRGCRLDCHQHGLNIRVPRSPWPRHRHLDSLCSAYRSGLEHRRRSADGSCGLELSEVVGDRWGPCIALPLHLRGRLWSELQFLDPDRIPDQHSGLRRRGLSLQ